MALIHSENWDGASPPSLPSGWNTSGTGWATTVAANGVTPTSAANMATFPGGASGPWFLTWGTADGVSGDVIIQCNLNMFSAGNPGVSGIFARGSASTVTSGSSYYSFYINWNTGELFLDAVVAGSTTSLANLTPIGGIVDWLQPTFTLNGSALSVTVQRLSDGHWLTSGGVFQSGTATVFSVTNTAISGSGYHGLYAGVAGGSYNAYWDDWSLSSFSIPSATASFGVTDNPDVASISGHAHSVASFGVTDNRDTAAAAATFKSSGAFGVTDRPDTATTVGSVENAIMSRLENPDIAAISATWTAPASLAVLENPDVAVLSGDFRAATVAAVDHPDTASLVGAFRTPATFAVVERPDVAVIAGNWHTSPIFAAIDHPDIAAIAAVLTTPAHLAVVERPDVAAMTGVSTVTAVIGAVESRDIAAVHAFFLGAPPAIAAVDHPDIAEIVGVVPTLGYHVYASPAPGVPIDYGTVVATTAMTTWTSFPLSPGTWKFGVRAFDSNGEEQNLACAVTIVIDASGNDASNVPLPPTGLRAFATPGGSIRIEWWFPRTTGAMAPVGFFVYLGTTGTPNYASPAATVPYASGYANTFVSNISSLANGTTYTVGVRAYNASGIEKNTATVDVTADATGPGAVTGLTASAIV